MKEKFLTSSCVTLKNQIDPHFTLNTLNSISYYLLKNDKNTANLYLGKQSNLIRKTLENTDKIRVSLENELELHSKLH